MAALYALVHRDVGAISTFVTREEAEAALDDVFGDEPTWVRDLWVEPFDADAEPSERYAKPFPPV